MHAKLGAIIVVLFCSGCTTPDLPPSPFPALSLDFLCTSPGVTCRFADGGWIIEDLVLHGDGAEIGLEVRALESNLTLERAIITGFLQAIVVNGLVCEGCSLIVRNSTLTGFEGAGSTGIFTATLKGQPAPNLVVAASRIDGFGVGINWLTQGPIVTQVEDVTILCGERGIRTASGRFIVADVAIQGCSAVGLQVRSEETSTLDRLNIRDSAQALVFYGEPKGDATLRASVFADNAVGGVMVGTGSLLVEGNTFIGNGFGSPGDPPLPTNVRHAVFLAAGTVTIKANCFDGNPGWAVMTLVPEFFDMPGNWWGSNLGPRIAPGLSATPPPAAVGDPGADVIAAGLGAPGALAARPDSCPSPTPGSP